jgi:hypothetical protein
MPLDFSVPLTHSLAFARNQNELLRVLCAFERPDTEITKALSDLCV